MSPTEAGSNPGSSHRPFTDAYETGRLRRVYLRGRSNIVKRIPVQTAALNLGLLMRTLVGVGTPRSLQGRLRALLAWVFALWRSLAGACTSFTWRVQTPTSVSHPRAWGHRDLPGFLAKTAFTTGC
jgi:hypothetical protein